MKRFTRRNFLRKAGFITGSVFLVNKVHAESNNLILENISPIHFKGKGVNDLKVNGIYNGIGEIDVIVRIKTQGKVDTIEISIDNGITYKDSVEVYNTNKDNYSNEKLYTNKKIQLFSGLYLEFSKSSGHYKGDMWNFTLYPVPIQKDVGGNAYALNGKRFISSFGTRNLQLGENAFGEGKSIGIENTAIGFSSLYNNTYGFANTAVGSETLKENKNGAYNQAIGVTAMKNNKTGSENVAVGVFSLRDNESGNANTAVGVDTMRYNKDGIENTSIGVQSMYHCVSGKYNTCIGVSSGRGGEESLSNGKSFNFCVSVGYQSLLKNSGDRNVALGFNTGRNTISAIENVFIGSEAGFSNINGSNNVMIGEKAGASIVDGSKNIFIGSNSGYKNDQSANSQNSIVIGSNAVCSGNNSIAIGAYSHSGESEAVIGSPYTVCLRPGGKNSQSLGTPNYRWQNIYSTNSVIQSSDIRLKQDIRSLNVAERNVANKLKSLIKVFKFKEAVNKKGLQARLHIGLIAQEVILAFQSEGLDPFNYGIVCYDEWKEISTENILQHKDSNNIYGIRYDELLTFIISSL